MGRFAVVQLAAAALVGAGCGSVAVQTWPGTFYKPYGEIDFYDQTYEAKTVKIVCAQSSEGLKAVLTAPDGTQVVSTRPNDGTGQADIDVTGDRGAQTLSGAAVWSNPHGDWGFELDPMGEDHDVFFLHYNAAICPSNH